LTESYEVKKRGQHFFNLGSPFLNLKEVMGHNGRISELRQLSSYTSRSVCVGRLCLWLTPTLGLSVYRICLSLIHERTGYTTTIQADTVLSQPASKSLILHALRGGSFARFSVSTPLNVTKDSPSDMGTACCYRASDVSLRPPRVRWVNSRYASPLRHSCRR
jgi:hypothetical protein